MFLSLFCWSFIFFLLVVWWPLHGMSFPLLLLLSPRIEGGWSRWSIRDALGCMVSSCPGCRMGRNPFKEQYQWLESASDQPEGSCSSLDEGTDGTDVSSWCYAAWIFRSGWAQRWKAGHPVTHPWVLRCMHHRAVEEVVDGRCLHWDQEQLSLFQIEFEVVSRQPLRDDSETRRDSWVGQRKHCVTSHGYCLFLHPESGTLFLPFFFSV